MKEGRDKLEKEEDREEEEEEEKRWEEHRRRGRGEVLAELRGRRGKRRQEGTRTSNNATKAFRDHSAFIGSGEGGPRDRCARGGAGGG